MVLGKLLSGGLVDSVGKIVDDLHVSEEEKQQAKAKRGQEWFSRSTHF